MHDASLDVVATSKFAKKTEGMVKVQKRQAAKSTNNSYNSLAKDTLLLLPSNKVNLPQPVMSAPNDARGKVENSQSLISSKENRRIHHKNKVDLKDDAKLHTNGSLRSSMHVQKHKSEKTRHEEASSSFSTSFTKVAPEENGIPNIIQIRTLIHVDEATADNRNQGDLHNAIDHNTQGPGYTPSPIKRSSLSMRTLMQMEDKEKILSRPAVTKDAEDVDSFRSSTASKNFYVQLEEIKSSRKKSWSFSQGKASDNVVVMFPNPTFDDTTSLTSKPPDVKPSIDTTIENTSLDERAPTLPLSATTSKAVTAYPPSNEKVSTRKREKIVKLSPCSTTCNAQKSTLQSAPTRTGASASERASPKKQKWLCTLTHAASPTLIRRLPEAHEMKEIKQSRVPSTFTTPSISVGRPHTISIENKGDEEDMPSFVNAAADDDPKFLKESWSFGNPSPIGDVHTSSSARRSSLGKPGGGHSFSFLSKHFHAWKLAK